MGMDDETWQFPTHLSVWIENFSFHSEGLYAAPKSWMFSLPVALQGEQGVPAATGEGSPLGDAVGAEGAAGPGEITIGRCCGRCSSR